MSDNNEKWAVIGSKGKPIELDLADLIAAIQKGRISSESQVRHPKYTSGEWKDAELVPALRAHLLEPPSTMDFTQKAVLSAVAGLALLIVAGAAAAFLLAGKDSSEVASAKPTAPSESELGKEITDSPTSEIGSQESIVPESEPTGSQKSNSSETADNNLNGVDNENSNRRGPTVGDYIAMSDEGRLEYCELVAKRLNMEHCTGAELLWEVEIATRNQTNPEVLRQDLGEFVALIFTLMRDQVILKAEGDGRDQTGTFVVGKRRFLPIVWETADDPVFSFSIINANTGKIVDANVVTGPTWLSNVVGESWRLLPGCYLKR